MSARGEQYLEACKPKVVALIGFTAVVGMLLADPGVPPLATALGATVAIRSGLTPEFRSP